MTWYDPAARVLFVEFYPERDDAPGRLIPYAVLVKEESTWRAGEFTFHEYDLEWCQRDGTHLYRCSGSGGLDAHTSQHGGPWWAARGIAVTADPRSGPRLDRLPAEYRRWPFDPSTSLDEGPETEFAWCDACGCLPAVSPDTLAYDPDETPWERDHRERRERPCPHLVWVSDPLEMWAPRVENACA